MIETNFGNMLILLIDVELMVDIGDKHELTERVCTLL